MEQLSSSYNAKHAESTYYDFWLEKNLFTADPSSDRPKYSLVIPPPNVTGNLHIGHALNNTLQDILVRWKRMQGYDVLWLPGMDHAGIATQSKIEERLRDQDTDRHELGREAFLERAWEWKEEYATNISKQWRRMGLALDYSRERFTLDDSASAAVREAFVRMYEQGYIYRGEYIINWDPVARTALSDIEVMHREVRGHLYHIKYLLEGDEENCLIVATTRPETLLGDTAVAVHPDDKRYAHLIGCKVCVPFTGRMIPVIADEYVEQEFGSGVVKITPAHDHNDFEIGRRHNLEAMVVIDEAGIMNEQAGNYAGMDRVACRNKIVQDLQREGLLSDIEEHMHSVGHSERTGAVIEPYLSTQWFVSMKPLASKAIESQRAGEGVNFVPERFEKIYLHWIENVRDWCISRQLWWGHRIPAWYCRECDHMMIEREDPTKCSKCKSNNLKQDDDVLDTWFSSALWPFSALGWPDESDVFKKYYPTDVLLTGYDIIYFWVARMIFTALEFTDQLPFQDVLITGLVRDEEGRKMSKSLGNGIDPLEIIDKYGADAMRFMLSTGCTPGNDQRFRWERVESARNFANKVWNAARFVFMNLENVEIIQDVRELDNLEIADKWILHHLNESIAQMTRALERYDFGEAGRVIYNFMWDYFCDWYIEAVKPTLYGEDQVAKQRVCSVLCYVLDQSLRLLHPSMPFITEQIWQQLPSSNKLNGAVSILQSSWPVVHPQLQNYEASKAMQLLIESVTSVRNIRAELRLNPGQKIDLVIKHDSNLSSTFEDNQDFLKRLCGCENMMLGNNMHRPEQSLAAFVTGAEIFVPLEGVIDVDQHVQRLKDDLLDLLSEIERVDKKLSNSGFVSKAPDHIVAAEKEKREKYIEKRERVLERLQEIEL